MNEELALAIAKEAQGVAYRAFWLLQASVTSEKLTTGSAAVTPFATVIPLTDNSTNRISILVRGNTVAGLAYTFETQLITEVVGGVIGAPTEISPLGAGIPVRDTIGITAVTFGVGAGIVVNLAGKDATAIISQYEATVYSKPLLTP